MADVRAKLALYVLFFSCVLGFIIGLFIVELTGKSKDTLLVNMWDQIQELKTQINDIKRKEETISQQTHSDDSATRTAPDA